MSPASPFLCLLLLFSSAPSVSADADANAHTGLFDHEHPHPRPEKVGSFTGYNHGVKGDVYIVDSRTLFISGFSYDGTGPDAFFWASKTKRPSKRRGVILPEPYAGTFYRSNRSRRAAKLGRYDNAALTLTLPESLKTHEIKNLSVWCRDFGVNFGDVEFPDGLTELPF